MKEIQEKLTKLYTDCEMQGSCEESAEVKLFKKEILDIFKNEQGFQYPNIVSIERSILLLFQEYWKHSRNKDYSFKPRDKDSVTRELEHNLINNAIKSTPNTARMEEDWRRLRIKMSKKEV